MKNSLKVARGLQLVGALFLIFGVASCNLMDRSTSTNSLMSMSFAFIVGFVLIVGARIFEWMTKEYGWVLISTRTAARILCH